MKILGVGQSFFRQKEYMKSPPHELASETLLLSIGDLEGVVISCGVSPKFHNNSLHIMDKWRKKHTEMMYIY